MTFDSTLALILREQWYFVFIMISQASSTDNQDVITFVL